MNNYICYVMGLIVLWIHAIRLFKSIKRGSEQVKGERATYIVCMVLGVLVMISPYVIPLILKGG